MAWSCIPRSVYNYELKIYNQTNVSGWMNTVVMPPVVCGLSQPGGCCIEREKIGLRDRWRMYPLQGICSTRQRMESRVTKRSVGGNAATGITCGCQWRLKRASNAWRHKVAWDIKLNYGVVCSRDLTPPMIWVLWARGDRFKRQWWSGVHYMKFRNLHNLASRELAVGEMGRDCSGRPILEPFCE